MCDCCSFPNIVTLRCTSASFTLGTCLPGIYTLRYDGPGGLQAFLTVYVERLNFSFFDYTFVGSNSSNLSATTAFVASLKGNSTLLLQLAIDQLPLFGVDPSSIRAAVLYNASVVPSNTSNGTDVFLIRVQYNVTMVRHGPIDESNLIIDCAITEAVCPHRDLPHP